MHYMDLARGVVMQADNLGCQVDKPFYPLLSKWKDLLHRLFSWMISNWYQAHL